MRVEQVALASVAVVLGAVVGSSITALAESPRAREWVRRRSRCPVCGTFLRVRDLVPIASFLVFRGRCRSCGGPIPRWHFQVEVAAVVLFVLAIALGVAQSMLGLAFLFALLAILLALAVIDLRHFLLPDPLVFALAVVGFARSLLLGVPVVSDSLLGGAAGLLALGALAVIPWPRRGQKLQATRYKLHAQHAMGLGDVKLAGAMGLTLGLPGLLAALFAAFTLGGVVGVLLLVAGRAKPQSRIPFGPFLCGATALVLLFPELPTAFFRLF